MALNGESEEKEAEIKSFQFQQMMLDIVGARTYDSFDCFELNELWKKIGFALYFQPKSKDGYDEKQTEQINYLWEKIVKLNNSFSKHNDRVVISCIYNCIILEGTSKMLRFPVFVLRKCKNIVRREACRVFMDHTGRVYDSWKGYITENKLPKCVMILPSNGRYKAHSNNRVLLDVHLSPAHGNAALNVMDAVTALAGIGFFAVFLAGVTISAPIVLTAGVYFGSYSIIRNAVILVDRSNHKESINIRNAEARAAYLNIAAGVMSFAAAGATAMLYKAVRSGSNISRGAATTVRIINGATIGVCGLSLSDSIYDVYDQWMNDNQKPSMLTILELGLSLAIFAHSIHNFRKYPAIIDETHKQVINNSNDSLKPKTTWEKLPKEIGKQNNGSAAQGKMNRITYKDARRTFTLDYSPPNDNLSITVTAEQTKIDLTQTPTKSQELKNNGITLKQVFECIKMVFSKLMKTKDDINKIRKLFWEVIVKCLRAFERDFEKDERLNKLRKYILGEDDDVAKKNENESRVDEKPPEVKQIIALLEKFEFSQTDFDELKKNFVAWFERLNNERMKKEVRKEKRRIHSTKSKTITCLKCGGYYYI